MLLLVLAHPGCPEQNPKSRKTVVCVLRVSWQLHTHGRPGPCNVVAWYTIVKYLSTFLGLRLAHYVMQTNNPESGFNSDRTIPKYAHGLLLESPSVPSSTDHWPVRARIKQKRPSGWL